MSAGRPRLFYGAVEGERALVEGEEAAHLARVLRMKPGGRVRVATDDGAEVLAELTAVSPARAEARIVERLPKRPPSPLSLRLGVPLIKGERFEWVLEKGAELGVDVFHPLALAHCEARVPGGKLAARLGRWRRILREAAKQCDRVPPPRLREDLSLDSFLRESAGCDLKITAWLGEGRLTLRETLRRVPARREGQSLTAAVLTGPEGDLTPEEVQAARAAGFAAVDLGPRVLRADTAPVALAAILQHALGEMG